MPGARTRPGCCVVVKSGHVPCEGGTGKISGRAKCGGQQQKKPRTNPRFFCFNNRRELPSTEIGKAGTEAGFRGRAGFGFGYVAVRCLLA